MLPFNLPCITNREIKYVKDALKRAKICGDGHYTKAVNEFFRDKLGIERSLLTTSCTHALEMSAILLDFNSNDEVILPSYTFVSTANAFVLRGGKPVFVDIDPDTMCMDPELIPALITSKTKAICPVHYAGVCCDMDKINSIAKRHNLKVVEDAAQALGSKYKGHLAGTIGDIGCFSFHETKNYVMGEGGAFVTNDPDLMERAEIIREKGTDRSRFYRGQIDKYTWQEAGSSFLPSDILVALLLAQLERFDEIMGKRMRIWNTYYEALKVLEEKGIIRLPVIPEYSTHNAHMFYLILPDLTARTKFIEYLKRQEILSVFHYVPLHSSPMGQRYGYKNGMLPKTEYFAERLVRLPLYAGLSIKDIRKICESIVSFFTKDGY